MVCRLELAQLQHLRTLVQVAEQTGAASLVSAGAVSMYSRSAVVLDGADLVIELSRELVQAEIDQ